jgi:hypothetical protein
MVLDLFLQKYNSVRCSANALVSTVFKDFIDPILSDDWFLGMSLSLDRFDTPIGIFHQALSA